MRRSKMTLCLCLSTMYPSVRSAPRATALLRRAASAGSTLLPLRVAEALDCERVVLITDSLPSARRAAQEWRHWASSSWDTTVAARNALPDDSRRGAFQPGVHRRMRSVCFCSFASSTRLAAVLEDAEGCDLLVLDNSGVHPRAAASAPDLRVAAHDGFLAARRRLFIGSRSSLAPFELDEMAPTDGDAECIVSDAGKTCLSTSDAALASRASEAPWHGPVCQWLQSDDDEDVQARLSITTDSGLVVVTPDEVRLALRPILAQVANESERTVVAPHLTELAVAVLYAFVSL